MLTILLFVVLTLVYMVIAVGIIHAIAWYYCKDPWVYVRNNNTWLWALIGMFATTFVIACFNFGPALLLPESTPTLEQRGEVANFFNHLLHGKNAPAKSIPTEPLPWATGTWFWWKATLFYFLLIPAYACFALSDEVGNAYRGVMGIIERRREERRTQRQQPEHPNPGGHHPHAGPAGPTGHSFGELLKVEFIVEIVTEIFKAFLKRH